MATPGKTHNCRKKDAIRVSLKNIHLPTVTIPATEWWSSDSHYLPRRCIYNIHYCFISVERTMEICYFSSVSPESQCEKKNVRLSVKHQLFIFFLWHLLFTLLEVLEDFKGSVFYPRFCRSLVVLISWMSVTCFDICILNMTAIYTAWSPAGAMVHIYCTLQSRSPVLLGNQLHYTVVLLKGSRFGQIRRGLMRINSVMITE